MSPLTAISVPTAHYQPKDFNALLGIPGFSERMLHDHFKLYEGYVKNTNELIDHLASYENGDRSKDPAFADRKRRFAWEFNGMRLHEYYFGNLTKHSVPLDPKNGLSKKIAEDFGSFENWSHEFTAIGAMRGIGWTVLAYDAVAGRLFDLWINEHDLGLLVGAAPLLVLDVFEHAYMADYGLERGKYISAFMDAIDWPEIGRRFGDGKKG